MMLRLLVTCLLPVVAFCITPLPNLSEVDQAAYKEVFTSIINGQLDDLASIHHALNGLQLLGIKADGGVAQKVCAHAQSKLDQSDVTSVYHASGIASLLPSCKLNAPKAHEVLAGVFVVESPPVQEVYFAASATVKLGLKLDQTGLFSALTSALKKDDTPSGLGYALHAAKYLENNDNAALIFARVEDLVGQADEVENGKYMQFDGGISVTAIAVSGVYTLADKLNKAPALKTDQSVKLANYLLSRRGVRLVRPAAHLLKALTLLTTNKFHIPLSVSLTSSVAVSGAEPSITVKVCNVLGSSVGAVSVSIDSAEHTATRATVLSKQSMQAVAGQDGSYKFTFLDANNKRERGFYKLLVSAGSATDKRLIGASGVELAAKVVTSINVEDVELQALDRDQSTTSKVHKPKVHSKVGTVIEADYHQKINMKFVVREKATGTAIKVHQAFVVFSHLATKQEIVFVAEPDATTSVYKFDVDLQKASKDFDNLSGRYSMRLVVGDAVVANPVDWNVADFELKFMQPEGGATEVVDEMEVYKTKKEIKHTFRQPEKRPPGAVSDVFTILVFVPVLIVLVLWLRVGINFGNMPVSIFTLGFHVGFAGILGLYGLFWLKLDMFTTLKYLAGVGGITFLCANRMLRTMAERRKAKTE